MRGRRLLERQIASLERRVAEADLHVNGLLEQQGKVDLARRDELDEAAHARSEAYDEGLYEPHRQHGDGTPATGGHADQRDAAHAAGTPAGGSGGMGAVLRASQAVAGFKAGARGGRRRSISEQRKHMESLSAYTRLFMEEDLAKQETYHPFDREGVRRQMRRALSAHVLTDLPEAKEQYFDLCLNRARSAGQYNVFPRFADWELEQLVLLFGRFDADHDGVLEFTDFCRLMLLVGERIGATYLESDMLRMFKKVDVNGDRLIDLNEFLLMQITAQKGDPRLNVDEGERPPEVAAGIHPPPTQPSAREEDDEAWDEHGEEAYSEAYSEAYEEAGEYGEYGEGEYGEEQYGDEDEYGEEQYGDKEEYGEDEYGEGEYGEGEYGEGSDYRYQSSDRPTPSSISID